MIPCLSVFRQKEKNNKIKQKIYKQGSSLGSIPGTLLRAKILFLHCKHFRMSFPFFP